MNTGIHRKMALGVVVTLAVVVLPMLLWEVGSAANAKADSLDVCPSGCPYTTIQDALYAAEDEDTVRVAAGTYTGSMLCDVAGVGTFSPTVCITEDITLLGGYNPVDFGIRDPDQYTTTIQWAGDPDMVVMVLVNGTSATVDGFQITGATGAPIGAIYIKDSAPTIRHNRIVGNHSTGNGGGIYVSSNSTPIIESNAILSNTVGESGGGIAVRAGNTVVISGNLIAYNEAITKGGGIFVEGSVVTVTNNQILSNTVADNGGGGFLAENGSTFVMSGNTFDGNFAGCCGGGMAAWWDTMGTIASNEFASNSAGDWIGGGIFLVGGPYDVFSNTITYNEAITSSGGGIGIFGDNTDATIVDNLVMSNTAQWGGGGVDVSWGPKAVVQSNQILSNISHEGIGSGLSIVTAEVLVDRNLLAYNINDGYDWGNGTIGVAMEGPSRPVTVTNNVIVDNMDKGIMVSSDGVSDLSIVNNTIATNRNEGVLVWGTNVVQLLRNNVITSNEWCGVAAAEGAEIQTIDYNDVWNNGGGGGDFCDYGGAAVPPAPGPGSISVDPQFIDPSMGDYHLAWGSPAMNTGTTADAPDHDKDGISRPQMGSVDMGAYEQAGSSVFLPIVVRNWAQSTSHDWEIEVVDTNGSGTPSMVLDRNQQPHMAYGCSGTADPLCYAIRSETQWLVETVGGGWGEVSLALDAADHPHMSSGNGNLFYSYFDGSSWTVQTVEPYIGGGLGRNSALVLDGSERPHIMYYGSYSGGPTDLWHAFHDGSQWVKEIVASNAWGDGRGFSSGLLADSGGDLYAIYTSGTAGPYDVSYAHYDDSTWNTQVIAPGSAGSIAMAQDGSLHASFVSGSLVRHAKLVGSAWVIQDVAAFGTPHTSPLGWVLDGATSIQMDSENKPHIAFYNQLDWDIGQLCYARWDGTQWQLEVVDEEGAPGFGQLSLALDSSDKAQIAYYDLANDEVRYAYLK